MSGNLTFQETLTLWGVDRGSPYRTMLLDFIENRARQLAARHTVPSTADAWIQRASSVRTHLLRSLGVDYDAERSPPQAQIIGALECEGYRIEKLIFEPRPGFPVSAHLYLPIHAHFPAPALLYAAGHWMEYCKLEPDVQVFCANLARRGFVALIYDPIGQGERLGDRLDHGHLEPLLVGLSQAGLMVWESIRALDYLVSRSEVDPQRIGMTGHSGGGLNTFYTSAIDERVKVSLPVCFVNTFLLMTAAERDRNWEDGMDLCNQVPEVMAYAEMSDICGVFAPKPLCIMTATQDWMFPIEGVRAVYQDIECIYRLLDGAEHVRLVEVNAPHSYNREMRQTAYGWLARWLQDEGDGSPSQELDVELFPLPPRRSASQTNVPSNFGEALCFPTGHAPRLSPAITALAAQVAHTIAPARELPTHPDSWAIQRRALLEHIPAVLGAWPEVGPLWPDDRTARRNRTFNRVLAQGLIAERVVFESEPGIDVPGMFVMPIDWDTPVPIVVYIDEWGKGGGVANGIVAALLAAGCGVLAIDVRGVGETATSDFEAATGALMTDRPLFGQRVWDVLSALARLRNGNYVSGYMDAHRIGCIGRGVGGLQALYAAALDESIAATVVWESPVSYTSLIVERPDFPPSTYLFDVLHHFDLPDIMAAVAPRPLLLANPVDGLRMPLAMDDVAGLCAWPGQVYDLLDAAGDFRLSGSEEPATLTTIAMWLRTSLLKVGDPA